MADVRDGTSRSVADVRDGTSRSAMSYEREIRSLSKALSDECANSLRLAQELAVVKKERDEFVAYWEQSDA